MMKKNQKRILSGFSATSMLMSGVAACVAEAEAPVAAAEQETATVVQTDKVANVQGRFTFDQDTVTPGDRVFNLFGTVVTGFCAKPAFAFESEEADYFVNVGGKIAKSYTVNLKKEKTESRLSLCACATGGATANVEVTGVKLSDVLQLADMEDGVNTIRVTGADGYTSVLPLTYVLDKEAMIVYSMNGENMVHGTQFWVPGTVAKYFTRNVVSIELLAEENEPEVAQRDSSLRAEVALLNETVDTVAVGQEMTFDGYADDLGEPIAAVEFTMDGGETWTSCETNDVKTDRWVCWHFAYTPEAAGTYTLGVRAKTQTGRISALEANVTFTVTGE